MAANDDYRVPVVHAAAIMKANGPSPSPSRHSHPRLRLRGHPLPPYLTGSFHAAPPKTVPTVHTPTPSSPLAAALSGAAGPTHPREATRGSWTYPNRNRRRC
jgi:hypothetical protein